MENRYDKYKIVVLFGLGRFLSIGKICLKCLSNIDTVNQDSQETESIHFSLYFVN